MAKIIYIENDGTEHTVEVKNGLTLMEGAVRHDIPGIDAECGGACACATCHVYIDKGWLDIVGSASIVEASMLEYAQGAAENSRLSCQIKITDVLDGLIITMPATQK